MTMTTPPTYLQDIPGVLALNPTLPPLLESLAPRARQALTSSIQAGEIIETHHLSDAEFIATYLRGLRELFPLVTQAVVASAELRAFAIKMAQAAAFYTPGGPLNVTQQMQDTMATQLQSITDRFDQRLDQLSAKVDNNMIMVFNQRKTICGMAPLKKTIPGHGLVFAQAMSRQLDLGDTELPIRWQPTQPAAVGTTPPNFNPNLLEYTVIDILDMVVFYNDDFGITDSDSLISIVDKFHRYLLGPGFAIAR